MRDSSNRATCVQTFVGVLLLVAGVASCGVVTLILAFTLFLSITGFEWDGPILWDRVLGLVMCPSAIGILLVAIGYSITSDRHKEFNDG
jgi:hypothetical protein